MCGSDLDEEVLSEQEEEVEEDDAGEDLNRVTQWELEDAKSRMNTGFEANRLKPGDEGFEYDVQVDFEEATEDCGWDSD